MANGNRTPSFLRLHLLWQEWERMVSMWRVSLPCEAQETATSCWFRPNASAAPLSINGNPCRAFIAERGNMGKFMSPELLSKLPFAIDNRI